MDIKYFSKVKKEEEFRRNLYICGSNGVQACFKKSLQKDEASEQLVLPLVG